ncbi:sigma-70 family RNA polymerase sigma factor [Phycisphaeraceae bacterium D3-23]
MNDSAPDPVGLSEELAVRWTRAQPVVASFIGAVVRDYNDAEDVLQEVAAAAARNYAKSDRDRPFLGWAMGIARHKIADYQRRYYREKLVFNSEVLERIGDACESIADERSERKQALDVCVEKLQPRGKQMLEMRYTHGLSPTEIGDHVGMSANAVAVSLHRLRTALGECVKRFLAREGQR